MSPKVPGQLHPSKCWIGEYLRWDHEDTRPRREALHPRPKIVKRGVAEGSIIAGNLGTMLPLAGTRYFPNLKGAILCVEEDESETPASVDRFLTQLRLMGAVAQIAALIVGRFHPKVGFSDDDSLEELLLTATQGFDLPIAIDFDVGHTDPMFILPNGVLARVNFTGEPRLALLESGVSGPTDEEYVQERGSCLA